MSYAVEINHLHKEFKNGKQPVKAVNDLSFAVPTGAIYGFLGHNGAGKSTTIRMMLGLMAPTAGDVRIFGESVAQAQQTLRNRVGSLVEGATFYPFLSGRANLDVLARTSGCFDRARIKRLLARVGLIDHAERPVRGYSTGMKQRLGIAASLLNDPDLIILDEPTNGLDPAGIQAIRHLIRGLVDDDGKTVLLSSHLLNEVEQICDRVAIIQSGHLLSEGAVDDLLAGQTQLKLEALPQDKALAALNKTYEVVCDDTWLYVRATRQDAPHIVQQLVAAGVEVYEAMPHRLTLEDYYLTLIQPESEAHHA